MERNLRLTLSDEAQLCEISRALSVPTRVQMLKLLNRDAMNINELAKELEIPVSTAALHVKVLADAGLIFSTVQPGLRGSQKVCSRKIDFVQLDFMEKLELTKTGIHDGVHAGRLLFRLRGHHGALRDCRREFLS